jgi:hypothetical protein
LASVPTYLPIRFMQLMKIEGIVPKIRATAPN